MTYQDMAKYTVLVLMSWKCLGVEGNCGASEQITAFRKQLRTKATIEPRIFISMQITKTVNCLQTNFYYNRILGQVFYREE
jgi:hypothetical protein